MLKNGRYVYWKEQCEYCINAKNCGYIDDMKIYLEKLEKVKAPNPVYGSLHFECDYFIFDIDLYDEKNPMEYHCCG